MNKILTITIVSLLSITAHAQPQTTLHHHWSFHSSTNNIEAFTQADRQRTIREEKKYERRQNGFGGAGGVGDTQINSDGSASQSASSEVNQSRNSIWATLGDGAVFNLDLHVKQEADDTTQKTQAKQHEEYSH